MIEILHGHWMDCGEFSVVPFWNVCVFLKANKWPLFLSIYKISLSACPLFQRESELHTTVHTYTATHRHSNELLWSDELQTNETLSTFIIYDCGNDSSSWAMLCNVQRTKLIIHSIMKGLGARYRNVLRKRICLVRDGIPRWRRFWQSRADDVVVRCWKIVSEIIQIEILLCKSQNCHKIRWSECAQRMRPILRGIFQKLSLSIALRVHSGSKWRLCTQQRRNYSLIILQCFHFSAHTREIEFFLWRNVWMCLDNVTEKLV